MWRAGELLLPREEYTNIQMELVIFRNLYQKSLSINRRLGGERGEYDIIKLNSQKSKKNNKK